MGRGKDALGPWIEKAQLPESEIEKRVLFGLPQMRKRGSGSRGADEGTASAPLPHLADSAACAAGPSTETLRTTESAHRSGGAAGGPAECLAGSSRGALCDFAAKFMLFVVDSLTPPPLAGVDK